MTPIENLKMCAEFLSNKPESINEAFGKVYVINSSCVNKLFNPHEKEGRHHLVDIIKKFDDKQRALYFNLMKKYWHSESDELSITWWFHIAPSEICFKCICEVLNKELLK